MMRLPQMKKTHVKINITGMKPVSRAERRRVRLRLFFADRDAFFSGNSQSHFYLFDIIERDVSNSETQQLVIRVSLYT